MNDTALAAAFQATTYRVLTSLGAFDLRIGRVDAAFDAFLAQQSLTSYPAAARDDIAWGIVTAFNPGTPLTDEENECRQHAMEDRLVALRWAHFPARNIADDDLWPVERSCLLVGVDEQSVCALAREFGQLAAVGGRWGTAPRLLWIGDHEDERDIPIPPNVQGKTGDST